MCVSGSKMSRSLITKNQEFRNAKGNSASALACKLADSYLLLAYSGIVVAKHQGFRLSGELNSSFLRSSGSAVQERVLPSRIKWLRTNTACSTALSRFHPRPPSRLLPMDHGYMVDVAHLLFTASADSHDTQRRRRSTGAASSRRTMGFATRLQGETITECTPV